MKASVFIASSLDGFIARTDGDIDWLTNPDYDIDGEDFGYSSFIKSVDVILMGRNTFEKVLTFDQWHYTVPVRVCTHRTLSIPDHLQNKVDVISGDPSTMLEVLSKEGFVHAYVDGGLLIQQFLKAKLIAEITLTLIPVLLGSGIPLFGQLEEDIRLELLQSKNWENGLSQNHFKVLK
jgi:dihydrofolate reductase